MGFFFINAEGQHCNGKQREELPELVNVREVRFHFQSSE